MPRPTVEDREQLRELPVGVWKMIRASKSHAPNLARKLRQRGFAAVAHRGGVWAKRSA